MSGKTLDELERVVWGEPTYGSHLVTTCHDLRTKPIEEFTAGDLRIMIGQQIGLPHLVPLAVTLLEREPLAEGDYYPGDLLASMVRAREWLQAHPEWLGRVVRVAEQAVMELGSSDSQLKTQLIEFVERSQA